MTNWRLVAVNGTLANDARSVGLAECANLVGRSRQAKIRLSSGYVSRNHAAIIVRTKNAF